MLPTCVFTRFAAAMRVVASVAIDGDCALVLRCTIKELDLLRSHRRAAQQQKK